MNIFVCNNLKQYDEYIFFVCRFIYVCFVFAFASSLSVLSQKLALGNKCNIHWAGSSMYACEEDEMK